MLGCTVNVTMRKNTIKSWLISLIMDLLTMFIDRHIHRCTNLVLALKHSKPSFERRNTFFVFSLRSLSFHSFHFVSFKRREIPAIYVIVLSIGVIDIVERKFKSSTVNFANLKSKLGFSTFALLVNPTQVSNTSYANILAHELTPINGSNNPFCLKVLF